MQGQAGAFPSPQVLASEPFFEGGGFASRSLDSSRVGAAAFRGNPRNLLTRWLGERERTVRLALIAIELGAEVLRKRALD
jgi:hypothetical protein